MSYPKKWNLECFFQGGSDSKEFSAELTRIRSELDVLQTLLQSKKWKELLETMQDVDAALRECDAFILCLESQNTADDRANQLRAELSSIDAEFQKFNQNFDVVLSQVDFASWEPRLQFILQERKQRASQKLSSDKENLITDLSIDGYHGWGDLYPSLVSQIRIPFQGEELSFGQAENQLSHPDRQVRDSVFFSLEKAWKQNQGLFAQVLNHIAGFRLKVYEKRKWIDPIQEPLFENRMKKETLQAMWDVVSQNKKPFCEFMKLKAKLLKVDRLAWYDVDAPLFEKNNELIPYEEAVQLIVDHFTAFHPPMGEFARKACSEGWIEAEDRAGKRPGGFCVAFPKSKQTRIFMTYSGTMVNLMTLAHELGHAYHQAMVEDLPSLAQHYRMNVAETASTFAEQIMSDALLKKDPLKILADRIQRSIIFFMNIHARFLFETRFYEARKNGFLSAEELCAMMQHAQEEAFQGSLSTWHPYFWASKLHFYFTTVPFYNFPYTFGYLFSLGLYSRGKQFDYDALLKDTGVMSVEGLAKKHLGVDLTKPDFWEQAMSIAVSDIKQFLSAPEFRHVSSEGTYQTLGPDRGGSRPR